MRINEVKNWLKSINTREYNFNIDSLTVASSDASFRSYLRVTNQDNSKSYIVMDAPPQHENCDDFIKVTNLFANSINVPHIFALDLTQGFLLLTDFGDTTLFQSIKENNNIINLEYYSDILDILINLQLSSKQNILPNYDANRLLQEMHLFNDWYVEKHCNKMLNNEQRNALENILNIIVQNNIKQKNVYVHRDYHSRNIMKLEHNANIEFGIIDFQDAVYGSLTYDLVSLLKDAYIELEQHQHDELVHKYWASATKNGLISMSLEDFIIDYELMGLQRHLKVLGIFARLYHRDGKSGYLNDLLLVLKYTQQMSNKYKEFKYLADILNFCHRP